MNQWLLEWMGNGVSILLLAFTGQITEGKLTQGGVSSSETPQWSCTEPQWVGTPGMQNGKFVGAQELTCVVQLGREGQFLKLDQHFLAQVAASQTVHAGPVEETYQGLPSVRFDVTIQNTGSETVTIRQNVHIATDRTSRLIFDSESQSISGSGMAAYLRKLNTGMDIRKSGDPTRFEIKMSTSMVVDKPWYAPTGTFVSKVKESAVSEFRRVRDETLPTLTSKL